MRARVRVAMRLASRSGQPFDTLQRYYTRLRDRRPVPTESRDLIKCPLCDRRVYRQPPTSGQRKARDVAFETNVYPEGPDVDFTPHLRNDDELDLSL